ncbi:MAG TPA: MtrB/PioB family outer membrane beta-barrel protein [Xanthobacteraceae bacterium]|nr:MtrB/PioB family outer membrane beta-barrel protein [Xanthobacteraceae bacterium]
MSYKKIGLVRACVFGAVLGGAAFLSPSAFAQVADEIGKGPGCCQGGGASGANAWATGLSTSAAWPADPGMTAIYSAPPGMPTKAPPAPPPATWWTHGELEVGGRDFLNNPDKSGSLWGDNVPGSALPGGYGYLGQHSLAKYYEYSTVAPGAFGGTHAATGTTDGLYQIDLWANNIGAYVPNNGGSYFDGFSDQSYLLTASKVGEHYFWASWDMTPHVYSTSAMTPFGGVGTSSLTWLGGSTALPSATGYHATGVPCTTQIGSVTGCPITTPAFTTAGIAPLLQPIDLGIQRNTAAVGYRAVDQWTAWEFGADYAYMTRKGTQPAGIVELAGFMPTNVPAPVDDSTQNFAANGEYLGVSPWGQKFTFKVAYNGSLYRDNIDGYTVQNPFFPTGASAPFGNLLTGICYTSPYKTYNATTAAISATYSGPTANCGGAQLSTWPSNAANGFSETTTADLPWNSHYAGTTSYVMMTQNQQFLPMTNNPNAAISPNGYPWNTVGALPMQSLGGNIETILSNNVLTTKLTQDLTSKLTYRFYDFDNQTPRIIFPCWISYDGTGISYNATTGAHSTTSCLTAGAGFGSGYENTLSSLSISYIKQDATAELNWRPWKEWNVNVGGGWERYDYTEADAGYTNEYSVKGSVDYKPFSWLTARASGYYSDRIAGNYNYLTNVVPNQYPILPAFTPQCAAYTPSCGSWVYSSAYQQFMYDNRQRTKADVLLDVVVFPGVTVTPTFKYKDDYYPLNTATGAPAGSLAEGLSDQRMISGGADLVWAITPNLSVVATYYYEYYHQNLYSGTGTGAPTLVLPPGVACSSPPLPAGTQCLVTTIDNEYVNTVTVGARWAAIPNALDLDVRYTLSDGLDRQFCSQCSPGPQFPDDKTLFQRLDATATYKFDQSWARSVGFSGDILARLRYTWERNAVANWQNDTLAPFTDIAGLTNAIWMAYDNPNYNVQMLAASLVFRW